MLGAEATGYVVDDVRPPQPHVVGNRAAEPGRRGAAGERMVTDGREVGGLLSEAHPAPSHSATAGGRPPPAEVALPWSVQLMTTPDARRPLWAGARRVRGEWEIQRTALGRSASNTGAAIARVDRIEKDGQPRERAVVVCLSD
ncbi:MAG TPA: hypothetical protein VD903_12340 [Pseudonocardia sp.]|nr:hypothetical protein [Pseudonocardia sp.]